MCVPCSLLCLRYSTTAREVKPEIQPILADYIEWLLLHHPLQGSLRACHKLITLLKGCDKKYHERFVAAATKLQNLIITAYIEEYNRELAKVTIEELIAKIQVISTQAENLMKAKKVELKQTSLTGVPAWFKQAGETVEKSILVQLLMRGNQFTDWAAMPSIVGVLEEQKSEGDAQQIIIAYLREVFFAEYILTTF